MIESLVQKINHQLTLFFKDVNERYRLRGISDALFRHSKEFVLRKGKRLRPLLFVLAYQGYSRKKKAFAEGLFASSAAIELLHDYMLVHDDVIDNSSLRRGKPTLHKVFDRNVKTAAGAKIGRELAIVAGDVLFALAVEAFLSIRENMKRKEQALRQLLKTAAYTGAGEFIDVAFSHRGLDSLTEKDIFLNYTLKTAKYTFECPLVMGAILAGAPRRELEKLSKAGIAAGQAFQIYDDFLDLFATQNIIGKPVMTDLAESKKTLLVFTAWRNLKGSKKALFKRILEKKDKKRVDLKLFRRLIVESGSYDDCLKRMSQLQTEATRTVGRLRMKPPHKKALVDLIVKLSPHRMPLKVRRLR